MSMDIPMETFNYYFTDSLERARSAGQAREELATFLTEKYTAGSSLFFSCKKWYEEVEIEEEVEEQDPEASMSNQEASENQEQTEGNDVKPESSETVDDGKTVIPADAVAGMVPDSTNSEKPSSTQDSAASAIAIDLEPVSTNDTIIEGAEGTETEDNDNAVEEIDSKTLPARRVTAKRVVSVEKSIMLMAVERMTSEMCELPTCYFIRSYDAAVPSAAGGNVSKLSEAFEFGVFCSVALSGIASLMAHVYLPTIRATPHSSETQTITGNQSADSQGSEMSTDSRSTVDSNLRHELSSSIHKFEQQIRQVVQQGNGDVRLSIPQLSIQDVDTAAADPDILRLLEKTFSDWTQIVSDASEKEHGKVAAKQKMTITPLYEIEFWRESATALSALYEQLTIPRVVQMVTVLKSADSPILNTFHFHFQELTKLYLEAKDNVKFLTTLERHFKYLATGSFQTVIDSMFAMLNGLKMVWVISRHYNTDDRMSPLMESIGKTLVRRVKDEVRLSDLLALDFSTARKTVLEARELLQGWSTEYFGMRKKIEDSGSDHRWEFDRKQLFGDTDYMADMCTDLLEIIDALDHFHKFLGPELKAVTGDSAGIDSVLQKVDSLSKPLQGLPYDIRPSSLFDKNYEKPWESIMKKFRSSVSEIEKNTEQFVKESFRKLRSAEGAFDLVQNFQKIGGPSTTASSAASSNTSGSAGVASAGSSLKNQISQRFQDILEQYVRELGSIASLFNEIKSCPPIYKNFPPVAGAIAWARGLYQRAKKPIVRFKKYGHGLLDDEFGLQVKEQYLVFARATDAYINDLFADWEVLVSSTAVERLRQPILQSLSSTQNEVIKGPDFALPPAPYRVSFSDDLKLLIRESKYLDKLGFRIPEGALNVTLQEAKFLKISRTLTEKLYDYDRIMGSLTVIERQVMKPHIDELNATIKLGFYPLNWTSQRLDSFIVDIDLALMRFKSTVSQLQKNSAMIEDVVHNIGNTLLVQPRDFRGSLEKYQSMDISEFQEIFEAKRQTRLDLLVAEYNTVGDSFLLKVEEVVAKTATGCSTVLAAYYSYWERLIYNAVVKMILSSMAVFLGMLQCKQSAPLFKVTVSLNGKDLVTNPSLTDIDKFITKVIRSLAESAKCFIRWMNGTCIKTEPSNTSIQLVPPPLDDDDPFIVSFYSDIQNNSEIVKLTLSVTSMTNKVFNITNKYLDGWRRHDKVTNLWNPKRKQQVEKLRPSCANLDQAMAYFQGISETVSSQPTTKDIDFVSIQVSHVAVGVSRQAEVWKADYGEALYSASSDMLSKLKQRIDTLEENLNRPTDDLDSLKYVLNIIMEISDLMQDVELEIADIGERYRSLQRYSIRVPTEEMEIAFNIDKRWRQLYVDSKTRDLRLIDTKAQFRVVTSQSDIEFRDQLTQLRTEFLDKGPGVSSVTLDEGCDLLLEYKRKLQKLSKQKAELVNAQTLFDLDVKPYPALQLTLSELDQLERIYGLYQKFREFQETMSSTSWGELDIAALQNGAEAFERDAKKFPKELREIFTFKMVEQRLVSFKESLPLVVALKNDSMKARHWLKLMDVTGIQFDVSLKGLSLGNIFSMDLAKYASQVEEIINEANQESKIENELAKVEAAWRNNILVLIKYKKDGQDRGWILRAADDIKLELDDNMLNLQTISGSRFVGAFVDTVRKWEKTLNVVSECLEIWFTTQRKWQYLEGIFVGSEDIRMQLPEEAKKFDAIDKAFKAIMTATAKNPNVVDACTSDNRLQVLATLSDRLDQCQKSLSDYLDTKRSSFPRFFFISDDELLSVLGSSDPTSIQVHLLKLFDNVKEMTFGRNNKVIEAMYSVETEGFDFRTVSAVDGPVEMWMTSAEDEMHVSLRDITKEGVFNYSKYDRTEWLKVVLGMVGLVGSQIWWTWEVEDTFRQVAGGNKYAMKDLEAKLTGQLNALVAMVRDKLDKILRLKVNTLLIIDVHARDIVDGFVRESVLNAKEFAWESQLRFYWDRNVDDCLIKQCTGVFRYGYEYMGLNGRLVITPLTDRCYMTLTQALTFKLGGSPAGPAGTGKTETTKDLAKSLALPCYVINCGDGLDYRAMAITFNGLVQVGAWGCFDEFNRINIEVLSVVSAQLRAIQNSLIYDKPTCDIGIGGEMLIKRVAGFATCGFFITMNPGYAGRTELPDNLKALFRPVTMIVPDFLQICEIMLFSEGFEGAKILAKKMTVLYQLSKEQLSKQFHYDFGLRALKSVLVMAGGLKRQYQEMAEDLVLMRCLRDSNIPKFVYEDVPLFLGLINDLFPGMDCPRVGYENLKEAALVDLETKGFKASSEKVMGEQVDKVVQMYETQLVRHTTMIVGPTGGGKSLVLETLKNARLVSENIVVKMYVINPKAQPLDELYGNMDPATRDWTDGILSKLFRELNLPLTAGKENEMRWIIYDGDVDALWVENMNSVMDDNRLLTLPNGERIRLQKHCAMICETFDLQYASPATISRCGMVWVDPKNLGYRPYYERWVRLRYGNGVVITDENKIALADLMITLYDKYVSKCIDYVLMGMVDGEMGMKLRQVIPITNIDMVKQLCSVIDAFLPDELNDNMEIEYMYIFCLIWSLGAQLVGDSRVKFDAFIKKVARESLPDSLLYDYFYDLPAHRWEKWQSLVPAYAEPSPFRFYEVMVPTTDSVLYSHLLSTLAPLRPILFIGESGTAKTTIIQKYLSLLPSTGYAKLNINFSSRTTAADVQSNIEANVDKRSGQIYGPASGKKLIVFLDDMNMPKVDTYGTQQPIAVLHYLMGRGAVYDREKDLNLKIIKDLQYIGAMGPPGGGRNPVDTRFIALFNVFNLTPPTEAVLQAIYSSIIKTRFTLFSDPVKASAAKLTPAMLRLYNFIVERMPPTPSKFHYIFNLRDLSRVWEGVCNATTDVVTSSVGFVRLWRHECDRIFFDRLTTLDDQKVYSAELKAIVKDNFGDCLDGVIAEPCIFGDFGSSVERLQAGDEGNFEDTRLYNDMGDYSTVRALFSQVLDIYNQENKSMTLVLFEQALEHLCRIHRIIRNLRGNALLVGVGGSGKQSLTRLATFCAGYKLFQITLSRGYGEEQFKEDLKELYKMLGQSEVVFLFTDAHVVEEGFLEFINNMLTTGMVPALYAQDEKDALLNSVRNECKAQGIAETPDNLWTYYISKCRNNLHIVLAMSPSSSKLRIRCRNFPGLVSNAVIDWFFPWPADALQKVAQYFLAETELPEEHRAAVVDHLVFTHQNVTSAASRFAEELRRFYYVTPKNYLDFISNYKAQLSINHKKVTSSTKRLQGGLQKLIEAAEAVERMQVSTFSVSVV